MGRFRAELSFQRIQKALEEIQHERIRLAQGLARIRVYQRRENDRAEAGRTRGGVDPRHAGLGLRHRVDEGRVSWLSSMPSNCVSRLCPSISTVMPVPSETKNTVRRRSGMKLSVGDGNYAAPNGRCL